MLCQTKNRPIKGGFLNKAISAAIAAHLARGEKLERAVALGQEFITRAIAKSYLAGKHPSLNQQAR